MSSSEPDYQKLYKEQDKIINLSFPALKEFYLTGGTALSRYYLNHRYSDDLDFFCDDSNDFSSKVDEIIHLIQKHYELDETVTSKHDNFARIQVIGEIPIKIEFVNEKTFYWGKIKVSKGLSVDNPANILANKITAILGRDEPKDVVDIIILSLSYSFNWREVYHNAFKKHIMNEQDIAWRLSTFPVKLLEDQPWLPGTPDLDTFSKHLEIIVDDFLLARDNSLGQGKTPIIEAEPQE